MLDKIRAVLIVTYYDLMIFFRYKINIAWLIMTPFVYIMIGVLVFKMMGAESFFVFSGGATSAEVYSMIGYSVFSLANYCWQCGYKIENEITMGTVKMNFLLPIPKSTYVYGLSISRLISTGIFTILIFIICAIKIAPSITNLLLSMIFLTVAMIYFLGIALCVSSLSLILKKTGNIANLLTFAMQIVTGLMIPIRMLPEYMQFGCYLFPTTWAIDSVRCSLMGLEPLIPLKMQMMIMLTAAFCSNYAGNVLLRKVEKRLQVNDSIDIY